MAEIVVIIICPVAIAYSIGQIIKSVCISQCVYSSVGTLTVAFLDRFSPKFAQTLESPEVKTSSSASSHHLFPHFAPTHSF